MFSSKPKNIIYITAKSLAIRGEGISQTEVLTFVPDSIKNLEVTNKESFKTAIFTFIGKIDIKRQKILCVLGEDLLFEKRLEYTNIEQVKQEREKFISELPFNPDHIVCITLAKEKEVYFVATNKDIYTLAKEAFESMGWKFEAVVPIFVFPSLRGKESFSPEEIKAIISNKKIIKAANFLDVANGATAIVEEKTLLPEVKEASAKPLEENEAKEEKTPAFAEKRPGFVTEHIEEPESPKTETPTILPIAQKKKSKKFIGILIIVIILAIVGGGYYLTSQKGAALKFAFANPTATPMPTVVPTSTPIPTPSIAKKDVVVEVLNGTTIAGLAGKIKTQLVDAGYTNTTSGNAPTQDTTTTTVAFSSKVSQEYQTDIVSLLKKTFTNVTVDTTVLTGSTDVKIITGTP
ncbi:MAG TPA: LytR C-terminal domain-containing protein [Patescibacteria group bacterium]